MIYVLKTLVLNGGNIPLLILAAQGRFNRLLMRQKIIKKVFLNLVIFRFIGIFVSKMIPKYVFL